MLVNLTPNEENIRKRYEDLKKVFKDFEQSFEEYLDRFTKVDDNDGVYLDQCTTVPEKYLRAFYKEFTKDLGKEELYDQLKDKEPAKYQFGVADSIEQVKEYYKEEIEDTDKKWVILVNAIPYKPEEKGTGFQPYRSGIYIGNYQEQIKNANYYNDCEFGENYQGFLVTFRLIPVI